MLIDLISMSNYGYYNIQIANMLGLETAVYLGILLDINSKAIRKNKITDNYFTVDRKYITSRTTLNEDKQVAIEKTLKDIGILTISEESKNSFNINISALYTIIGEDDSTVIKDIKKIVSKKANSRSKADAIKDTLKANIVTSNEELRMAYCDWIDAVYAKQGWMSKKSVVSAQTLIDDFADHNLDVALKIIEIASINGYRDMEWALNNYKQNFNVKYKVSKQMVPDTIQTLVGDVGF
jgi:hypothetical protein